MQNRVKKTAVLCIEISPRMMRLASWILHPLGYEVVWAKDSEEGIALAKLYEPEIILVDLDQGLELTAVFLQQIKYWSSTQTFPQKLGILSDDEITTIDASERLEHVTINHLHYQDLPRWLDQLKPRATLKNNN